MPPTTTTRRLKPRVAVVGSGLAGLTTAYLLVKEGADVWLLDKAPRLGFHAWSVELDAPSASERSKMEKSNALALDLKLATPQPSRRGATLTKPENTLAVDVPMRSFQGGYYPLLIALYRHLGLPLSPAAFTFSFSALPPQTQGRTVRPRASDTYFIHSGASGASVPALPSSAFYSPLAFARAMLALLTVGVCYVVLLVVSLASWHGLLPPSITFRDLVDAISSRLETPIPFLPVTTPLGREFRHFAAAIVLPLFSAVGTMTAEDVWDTRADVLLDYIHAGVGTSHYVLGGGKSARDVASLLAAPVREGGQDRVRLGTAIRSLQYSEEDGGLKLALEGGGDEIIVDRVVVATQASPASALLRSLEPSLLSAGAKAEARRVGRMRAALRNVHYRDTIVVTHRDHSVLPDSADVRDINLVQPDAGEEVESAASASTPELASAESSAQTSPCPTPRRTPAPLGSAPFFPPREMYTMATHVVAPAPGVEPVLQTTNPIVRLDEDSVLGVARLERALPLADDTTLLGLRPGRGAGETGKPLVYLAGSYAYPGIPLLEGCVGSARRAVEDIMGQVSSGGVDWDAGRGGLVGRAWRWRWRARTGGY